MDLRQIEYIVKIADEGSITKAAAQCYISQSGLNQQLLKLEKELGVPLFHRSKYELRPTQAGQIYLTYGRRILEEKREAYARIHDLAKNNTGSFRIGLHASCSLILRQNLFYLASRAPIRLPPVPALLTALTQTLTCHCLQKTPLS